MDLESSYPWRQGLAAVGIGLLLLVAAVAVFGGGQTSTILSNVGAAIPAEPQTGGQGDPAGSGTGGSGNGGVDGGGQVTDAAARPPELLIIRTGQLEIVVADLHAAVAAADERVSAVGGYVGSSDETASGSESKASVVYRIPADRWDEALAAVRGLASQTFHAQVQTEAVTNQVVDLGARITNLRASEAALQAIMAKAVKISEVLDVQAKLTDVRGQIEQLVAEKQQLEQRAAFGTLTVVFSLPVTPKAEAVRLGWDPATDVDRATGALLGIGQAAATAGIWFGIVGLPLLVVLAILAVIAWRVRRTMGSRRAVQPGAGA
jgi:Domain of unknown function (DUF4349)